MLGLSQNKQRATVNAAHKITANRKSKPAVVENHGNVILSPIVFECHGVATKTITS